jgi:hypothetical protein
MTKGLLTGIVSILYFAGTAGAAMTTTANVDSGLKNDSISLIYSGIGAAPDSGIMALVGAGMLVLTILVKRKMNKVD